MCRLARDCVPNRGASNELTIRVAGRNLEHGDRRQNPEQITLEEAVELIAARAAKGPAKKAARKKPAKKSTRKSTKSKEAAEEAAS